MSNPRDFDELPPIVAERRAPRRRAFLGALAVSRDGRRTVECAVKEISASGARVQVPKDQVIPENCYLIVSAKDAVYEAVVVRAGARDIGLKFIRSYELHELTQPEMQFLRRLFVERMPRTGNDLMKTERRRRLPNPESSQKSS